MSQLPPKIPPQNWPPAFPPHQKMPPLTTNITIPPQKQPPPASCWVDEFLDFTSARRGTHRRSMSDSIAFLEAPYVENRRNALLGNCGNACEGFDRLDDEQLMSMFSDDVSGAGGAVSSPSDQTSNNDDKPVSRIDNGNGYGYGYASAESQPQEWVPKTEPSEIESDCKNASADNLMSAVSADNVPLDNADVDPFNTDPKRIKRVLANRQSAQRSRVRKLQYISELERSVTSLQTEVSVLSPRVAYLDHQRLILNVDNSAIKQRIAALAQDKIFKDAHQEALKVELERLRQIYHHQQEQQQNMVKMGGVANCGSNAVTTAIAPPSTSDHNMGCTEKEQLMT